MNNELKELYVTLVEAGLNKEAAILEKYLVKEAKDGKGPLGRFRQKMQDRRETKQELKPALKEMEKGKAFARQVAQEVRKGNIKRVKPYEYEIVHYNRLDRGFFRVLEKFEDANDISVDRQDGIITKIIIGTPELEKEVQQEQTSPTSEPATQDVVIQDPAATAPAEPTPEPAATPEPEPPAEQGPAQPAGSVLGIDPKYAYFINENDKSFTLVWIKGSTGSPNRLVNVEIPNNSEDPNMKKAWCKLKSFYSDGRGRTYTEHGTGASVPDGISGWTHTVQDACDNITWQTKN